MIRIKPEVYGECGEFRGGLDKWPVQQGTQRWLRDVQFRKHNPVRQHVAIYWKRGLPQHHDGSVQKLTALYGRRMTIEELFLDQKNRRHGWSLRNI